METKLRIQAACVFCIHRLSINIGYAFDFALVYKISNKMCARQVNCHGRLTEIRFLRLMRIVMLLAGLQPS